VTLPLGMGVRQVPIGAVEGCRRKNYGRLVRNMFRFIAHERRMAAIHEAGHLVISQMFGFPCNAWIWPHDVPGEKTWLGQTKSGPRFIVRRGATSSRVPTKAQKRMIAVAGAIAEDCWLSSISGELEIDWWDPNAMSETDWRLSGCPAGEPSTRLFKAADKVTTLLRPDGGRLWQPLILSARDLLVGSRTMTTHGEKLKALSGRPDYGLSTNLDQETPSPSAAGDINLR
jgi:hypothetical protein